MTAREPFEGLVVFIRVYWGLSLGIVMMAWISVYLGMTDFHFFKGAKFPGPWVAENSFIAGEMNPFRVAWRMITV